MKKDDKIFVTGGTGFVGAYILRELVGQGYQNIHAIHRETSDMQMVEPFRTSIIWHIADLLDVDEVYNLVRGSARVIHSAGLVSFAPADKELLYEINVHGTANIVNACLHHKVRRLIHLSSIAAIAKTRKGKPITEETKWIDDHHISHYGRSKHLGETEVWRGVAEGLEAIILNPSIILGAGDWHSSSCRLFMEVNKGLKYYPPGGTGFVDVRDVALIAANSMMPTAVNQRYIINESNYSFKSIFDWMAQYLGTTPPSTCAPRWVAKIIVFLESMKSKVTGTKPVNTTDSVRNSYENFHYDNQKIKSLEFSFIPIEKTIQETCQLLQKAAKDGFMPLMLEQKTVSESNSTA